MAKETTVMILQSQECGLWNILDVHPNDIFVIRHTLNKTIQLLKEKHFSSEYQKSNADQLVHIYEGILNGLSSFPKEYAVGIYQEVLEQL